MKKIILLILILNSILNSQELANKVESDSLAQQKPSVTLLFGLQFNEGVSSNTSTIIGTSFDLYNGEKISLPLDFVMHFMDSENHSHTTFFPRIALNLKYNFIRIGSVNIFLQGGIGVPVLFTYLFDFSPIIGVSYKKIRIDMRNTYYFEIDSYKKFGASRWPMMAIVLGLSI